MPPSEEPPGQEGPAPDNASAQWAGDANMVSLVLGALERHQLNMQRDLRVECATLRATFEEQLAQLPRLLGTSARHSGGFDCHLSTPSRDTVPLRTGDHGEEGAPITIRVPPQSSLHSSGNTRPSRRSDATRGSALDMQNSFQRLDMVETRMIMRDVTFIQPRSRTPWCVNLARFIASPSFDVVCAVVVMTNVIVMFAQNERAGYLAACSLRLQCETGTWAGIDRMFEVFDQIFAAWFTVELALRLWVYRCKMFHSVAYVIDAFIVLGTGIDQCISWFAPEDAGANLSFARMIRLVKLVKFLRAFRAATVFSELRVLIQTIASSFWALIWSVVLLGIMLLASGLFMAQTVSTFVIDERHDYDTRLWAYANFGSASRAVYSMFEATMSGCWPTFARPMIERMSPWYAAFWVVYIVTVVFAVIRVMGALFLSATLRAAGDDEEMMVMRRMRDKEKYSARLHSFFVEADSSGDGMLDREELRRAIEDPKFLAWLHVLELEVYEVNALFDLLDDGEGGVSFDEFLNAAIRVKGHARAIDSIAIILEQGRCKKEIENLREVLERLTGAGTGPPEREKTREESEGFRSARSPARPRASPGAGPREAWPPCGGRGGAAGA